MLCFYWNFIASGNVTFSKIKKRDNVPQFCFSRAQDLGTFLELVKHSGKTANSGKILVFSPVVHRISPLDL